MTSEEINIAIAEACGFKRHGNGECWALAGGKLHGYVGNQLKPIPNYHGDLNAMHEAENTLTEDQRRIFSDNLYHIAVKYKMDTGKWRILSLSAAQRAEAFLKTLNLWKP